MFTLEFTSLISVNKKEASRLIYYNGHCNRTLFLTRWSTVCVVVTLAQFKSTFTTNLLGTTI